MKKTILALATAAVSTVALAQSTNVISTSASQSTWGKIKENLSLSYYNELYGRQFNDFDNAKREALYNSVSLGYKVGNGKVFINPRFEVFGTTTDNQGNDRGSVQMINPRVGYSALLYGNDRFSIFNSSRLEIGINDAREEKNRLVKIKQYNAISFNLDSRNTLDLGVEVFRWVYDGQEEDNSTSLGIYAEAIHKYAFTDKVALLSILEFESAGSTNKDSNFFARAGDYSILKIGPEFALAQNTTLYTAALIGIDQEASQDFYEPSLFLALSTSI